MNILPFLPESYKSKLEKPAVFLASCFYTSSLPPKLAESLRRFPKIQKYVRPGWTGSGLAGSLWGFLTYWALPRAIAVSPLSILAGILFSVVVSDLAERAYASKDDHRIVIDEWIGTWVAMWGLQQNFGLGLIAAFALFRIFDVFKGPWGRRLQYLPGGWGIVLDDVVAGLIANFFARIFVVVIGIL